MIRALSKLFIIVLFAALLCSAGPSFAQEDDSSADLAAQQAAEAMDMAQKEQAMTRATLNQQITDKIDEFKVRFIKAMAAQKTIDRMRESADMPNFSLKQQISLEQIRSLAVAEYLRDDLNRINVQTILGYQSVVSQGLDSVPNIYKDGRAQAKANLYNDFINLFCISGSPNVLTEKCAVAADQYGVKTPENFIDFILGEKTWPNTAVLETMKLARAFYGYVPDAFDLDIVRNSPADYVAELGMIAHSNMKMAIIDDLAARRGPTSSATNAVLMELARRFLSTQSVSSSNPNSFCGKADKDKTDAEAYICGFTNNPDGTGGENRIISQAAIDRVTQYDTYLSPNFYSEIQGMTADSAMDKMEVFIKAQQLTQDYRELRLLQMKTAATAMRLMNQGDKVQ